MTNASPSPSASERNIDAQLERRLAGLADSGDSNSELDSEAVSGTIFEDSGISQQWTRRQAEGFDTLSGHFRCSFCEQQQRYALHIPLYPAMEQVPEVEAAVVDCESAKVRITDRQKFGLRLEVVLPVPSSESRKVLVELTAYAAQSN